MRVYYQNEPSASQIAPGARIHSPQVRARLGAMKKAKPDMDDAPRPKGKNSGSKRLTPMQSKLVKNLAKGMSITDAALEAGYSDKRLLVTEEEFSSPLRVMERAGNNLSAVVRDAWGRGDLQMLTKNSPARATGAHVSILGHVTREELLRYLNSTEASNGFANRFLWVCVKRSKMLPEGGSFRVEDHGELLEQLRETIRFGKQSQELFRDEGARAIWFKVYGELSEGKSGMFGSVTGRAEAQVVRLSLILALLDCSHVIRPSHMLAALAVWDYCEASARFIFGDKLGDPDADRILAELRATPEGLTRTEIRDLFQRHRGEAAISSALGRLEEQGLGNSQGGMNERHRMGNTACRLAYLGHPWDFAYLLHDLFAAAQFLQETLNI
jgi:hypothetical protein